MSSIKQGLISLRDPNGVAVRPSGFDCVRPCHSERSGAESNCEAAPSKAKVESRADSAQDDTDEKAQDGVAAEYTKRLGKEFSCLQSKCEYLSKNLNQNGRIHKSCHFSMS